MTDDSARRREAAVPKSVADAIEDLACEITGYGPGDMSSGMVQDHHRIVEVSRWLWTTAYQQGQEDKRNGQSEQSNQSEKKS